MFCSRCGTQLPDDARACTLCGLALAVGDPLREEGIATGPPPGYTPAAPLGAPPVAALVAYGGFWRRFLGCVIDAIVAFFPAATVRVLLGLGASSMFDPLTTASWWGLLFEVTFDWLYAALLISSPLRGTLGQLVMDLNVTGLRGERVTFARASARYVAQILNLLTLGIGLFVQLFTPRRQALHDLVTATVVVRPGRATAPLAAATGIAA